ncbi:MAG: hypothetical protein K0M40_22220 [Prolixibacteraceae bacterium]|nr:hypothetical protein [Prolixibacteraceae bacterium]
MVKRTTAIFFILLANIVLLVHAVVPHHHHQEQVCIVNSHCQTDSHSLHHGNSENDHQHDGNSESDCCVLKQAVAIPSNLVKQDFRSFDSDNDLPDFDVFQCVLFDNESDIFVSLDSSATKLHFLSSDYFHLVTASIGLRAPPIV